MSDEEFHVHGAREHLSHDGGHERNGPGRPAQYVAMVTALTAILGAVVGYQGTGA